MPLSRAPARRLARLALLALACGAACRAPRPPAIVRPPAGMDGDARAAWIAEQARRCKGRLTITYATGMVGDSAGGPQRAVQYLDGVQCRRR